MLRRSQAMPKQTRRAHPASGTAAVAYGVFSITGGTDMRLANAQSVSYLCAEAMRVMCPDGRAGGGRTQFDGDGAGLPV